MHRITVFLLSMMLLPQVWGQDFAIRISYDNFNDYAALTEIDSIYFSPDRAWMYVQPIGGGEQVAFDRAKITAISYVAADNCPTKVKIAYTPEGVMVDNPFFLRGVSVVADGAYVTIHNTNTQEEISTELSGETQDGALLYEGEYKTTIELNGLNLTSQRGAALDIECGKRVALELRKNTQNSLADAANGTQKAALYCKGHLEVDKGGTLNVTGRTAHAIAAKEYIKLKRSEGKINVLSAVKDGIHCKQYFMGNGFEVNIAQVGDDGIQAELDGTANDENLADGTIVVNGGSYTINNSTNGWTEGTESHTAKGMDAEGDMQLLGGSLSISMSGSGGKGIRVAGTYTQGTAEGEGPLLTISTTGSRFSNGSSGGGGGGWGGWGGGGPGGPGGQSSGSSAKAIKVMGQAIVYGGSTYVTTTKDGAEGLESKTSVTISGGQHYFRCYDDCIGSSGIVKFEGGNTVCYSNGNDAVDSNYGRSGAITIAGGTIFAYTTKGSPEEGLDCDNNSYIKITGGIAVSAGGSQGGGGWGGGGSSSSVGSSTQGYYLGSSPSSYSSSYYYTLCNTSGEPICTYRFEGNVSNSLSLLTAPNLGKGSVTVKRGSSAPSEWESVVNDASGNGRFYVAPTVETASTVATVTAK